MSYIPVVVDAKYVKDYKVHVVFDKGEEKIVFCEKWLDGEIFEP